MPRLLITGAAGFIGSRIVEIGNTLGHEIFAVDNFIEGNYSSKIKRERWNKLKEKSAGVNFITCDLRIKEDVLNLPPVDFIINEAAVPGLLLSWERIDLYLSCNVQLVQNLISYALNNGIDRFIHASTSSVYGKSVFGDESSPLKPISPYGVSKLAAENLITAAFSELGLNYTILRYFSVYGPQQRPDMAFSKIISSFLKNEKFKVTGDIKATRSNTFVDDIALATLAMISNEDATKNEIFNVSGDEEISLDFAISEIARYLGKPVNLEHSNPRKGDQLITKGDNSKLKSTGLFQNFTPFEVGITHQIESALSESNSK